MINNGRTGKCPRCGGEAFVTVHADGFDDAPASFTMKVACKRGPCQPVYSRLTAEEMHKATNLPLAGWSEAQY